MRREFVPLLLVDDLSRRQLGSSGRLPPGVHSKRSMGVQRFGRGGGGFTYSQVLLLGIKGHHDKYCRLVHNISCMRLFGHWSGVRGHIYLIMGLKSKDIRARTFQCKADQSDIPGARSRSSTASRCICPWREDEKVGS